MICFLHFSKLTQSTAGFEEYLKKAENNRKKADKKQTKSRQIADKWQEYSGKWAENGRTRNWDTKIAPGCSAGTNRETAPPRRRCDSKWSCYSSIADVGVARYLSLASSMLGEEIADNSRKKQICLLFVCYFCFSHISFQCRKHRFGGECGREVWDTLSSLHFLHGVRKAKNIITPIFHNCFRSIPSIQYQDFCYLSAFCLLFLLFVCFFIS